MRLLFFGDLMQTGFGTVTFNLGKALLDAGVDIRLCSLNEPEFKGWWHDLPEWVQDRAATFDNPDGWLVRGDAEAKDKLNRMFTGGLFRDGWTPEAAIILGDPGSLEVSPVLDIIPEGMPVWHHVPIEGTASPPAWTILWQNVQPVPTSLFGAQEIGRLLRREIPYVYHGVDTEVFHVPSAERPIVIRGSKDLHVLRSRRECKEFLGLHPDRFMILRADRNMARKRYPSLLRSLAPVLDADPNVDFWWHCKSVDQGGNMFAFRSHFPRHIQERMQPTGFHDDRKMATPELMSALYAAADLYVSVSAEGFGLTIAEAMACGTPAVAMDYSSVPEVLGAEPSDITMRFDKARVRTAFGGVLVPPAFLDDNVYGYFWAGVNERLFSEAVMAFVRMPATQRRLIGLRGSTHVANTFTWQKAAEKFMSIMAKSEAVAA